MSERMDYMKGEIINLQENSQTEEERETLALLAHTELKAHESEDFLKFKAIDDRVAAMAGNLDRKLDAILSAVTRNNR